ncbi:MAG: isochorismatase family protein [Candidatus Woesearchaeota archaeon]
MEKIIFYDVDTQNDFMRKDGALYVQGAEEIYQNLEALTKHALKKGINIFGSVDRHYDKDAELEIFPPHCMNSTEGQKKVLETTVEESEYIENRRYYTQEIDSKLRAKAVYFEKQDTKVFSNANAELLGKYNAAVVYGVATDYCVKEAVLGMRKRGIEVFVVKDAIKGVAPETSEDALKSMKEAGAEFVTTKDLLEGKLESLLREKGGY